MRKLVLLSSVGLLVAGGVTTALGCGDKLLALGRGIRLQRAYTAQRPASVLVYVGPQNTKSTLSSAQLQSTLKKAGHKLVTEVDASKLEQDLKSSSFDLVLAEYGDAVALAERMKPGSSKAQIVPVMGKANKAEMAAAGKQFAQVVKSGGDAVEYLTVIDQAMKSRAASKS